MEIIAFWRHNILNKKISRESDISTRQLILLLDDVKLDYIVNKSREV